FTTRSTSAIDPTSITGDEFTLTGAGVVSLKLLGTGVPELVAPPALITGTTYRYYLKSNDTTNTGAIFGVGEATVNFRANSWKTLDNNANAPLTVKFTITNVGPATATNNPNAPIVLGPLTLEGPTVGIADVGFKDGLLVLTIAVGVGSASLKFGNAQGNS